MTLPSYAAEWPAQIARIVEESIRSGIIDEKELAGILIGLNPECTAITLWPITEYESYPYGGQSLCLGSFPVSAWLDLMDGLVPAHGDAEEVRRMNPELRFQDGGLDAAYAAQMRAFYKTLEESAIAAATGILSKRFKHLVAVFIVQQDGVSEEYGYLVAFCHPEGAPLFNLQVRPERVYDSTDSFASLTPKGWTLFSPKEKDSENESRDPVIQEYLFSDVRCFWECEEAEGVTVQFKDRPDPVNYCNGSSQQAEKFGRQAKEQGGKALLQHLEKSLETQSKKRQTPNSLDDSTRIVAWVQTFPFRWPRLRALMDLCDRFSLDNVHAAIRRMKFAELEPYLSLALSEKFLSVGRPEEALKIITDIPKKHRSQTLEALAQTLFSLKRYAKVMALVPASKTAKVSDALRLYQALSVGALGKPAEGLKLLETVKEVGAELFAARARLQLDIDPEKAKTEVLALFGQCNDLPSLAEPLKTHPITASLFVERERRKGSVTWSSEWPSEVLRYPTLLHLPLPTRQVSLAKKDPEEEKIVAVSADANDYWVAYKNAGINIFSRTALDQARLSIAMPEGLSPEGITLFSEFPVVSCQDHLAWIDAQGTLHKVPRWFKDDLRLLASQGPLLAAAKEDLIEFYRRDPKEGLVWVARLSLENGLYIEAMAWAGNLLLVATHTTGLLVIDVSTPSAPKVRKRLFLGQRAAEISQMVSSPHWLAIRVERSWWLLTLPELEVKGYFDSRHDRLALCEEGSVLWVILPDSLIRFETSSGTPVPTETAMLTHSDQDKNDPPHEIHPLWLQVEEGVVTVIHDRGINQGAIIPKSQLEGYEVLVRKAESELLAWILEQLKTIQDQPDRSPIGALRFGWAGSRAFFWVTGQLSWPTLASSGAPFLFHKNVDVLELLPPALKTNFETFVGEKTDWQTKSLATGFCEAGAIRILQALASDPLVRSLGLGRQAFVLLRSNSAQMIHVSQLPGSWTPLRAAAQREPAKSFREQLEGPEAWENRDLFITRANRDETFRSEVLQIASEGNIYVLRIAMKISCPSPEPIIAAVLKGAEKVKEHHLHWLVDFLALHRERAEVRQRLDIIATCNHRGAALSALHVLGLLEEPRALQLLQDELCADIPQMEDIELWFRIDALKPAHLSLLRDSLEVRYKKAVQRKDENDLKMTAMRLFNAGRTEMPTGLMDTTKGERELENGETFEFFGEEEPSQGLIASRLFIALKLSQRVASLRAQKEDKASIWPEEIPPEPHPISWDRFWGIAKPILDKDGHWEELHRTLTERLSQKTHPDQDLHLAYHLVLFDIKQGDALVDPLRKALLAGVGSTLDKAALEKLKSGMGWATTQAFQKDLEQITGKNDVSGLIRLIRQLPALKDKNQKKLLDAAIHNTFHQLLLSGHNSSAKELLVAYTSELPKLGMMEGMAEGSKTRQPISLQESFAAKVLHLYGALRDEAIFKMAQSFIPKEITYQGLAFNVACIYAIRNDKPKMLEAIRYARDLGKPKAQFMQESDFDPYKNDPDFLSAVEG